MDLESEILKEHSKRQVVRIGGWIAADARRFKQLMELFLGGDKLISQRSAWIISYCCDNHPELAAPWLSKMLKKTREPGIHIAVKRNVMHVLRAVPIPRALYGMVVTICFEELESPGSAIAVRAFAMYVLAKIAKDKPQITGEIQASIIQMMPHAGPGLRACSKNVLKTLRNIESKGRNS